MSSRGSRTRPYRYVTHVVVALGPLGLGATLAAPAGAQAPEGLRTVDNASSGSTEVATSGFEAPTETEAPEKSKDATTANVSAGALITSGNTRSLAFTTSTDFRLRRSANQLSSKGAINYARSAAPGDDLVTTVENYQGKLRYDRFVAEGVALFLATSARRDRFQGLDLRLNVDPGVAYYFIDLDKHQLWTEGGYDLQHDIRRDAAIAAAAADGEVVSKTETRHSLRLFTGYINKLNEHVSFDTGLEYIQSVQETKSWRLNYDVSVTSAVAGRFSTATTVAVKYDNNPLPGIEPIDIFTSFNLVYTLL